MKRKRKSKSKGEMEDCCSSSSWQASQLLKKVRRQLKEWEHAFSRLHGHPPSKAHIKDSPHICDLYKQYASLKKKLSRQKIGNANLAMERNKENFCFAANSDLFGNTYAKDHHQRPSSPSAQSSDSSGGSEDSHISATPPKKRKAFHLHFPIDEDTVFPDPPRNASNIEALVKNTPSNSFRLGEVNQNSQEFFPPKVVSEVGVYKSHESEWNSSITKQKSSSSQVSEFGFRIKLQRCGERLVEKERGGGSGIENLPAGFFRNCTSSRPLTSFASRKAIHRDQTIASESLNTSFQISSSNEMDFTTLETSIDRCNDDSVNININNCKPCNSLHSDQLVDDFKNSQVHTPIVPNEENEDLFTPNQNDTLTDILIKTHQDSENFENQSDEASIDPLNNFNPSNLIKYKVVTLKKMLSAQGLSASGKKSDLISRLLSHTESSNQVHDGVGEVSVMEHITKPIRRTRRITASRPSLESNANIKIRSNKDTMKVEPQKLYDDTTFCPSSSLGSKKASKRNCPSSRPVKQYKAKKSILLAKKAGDRGNFVKLNINGKGRRSRQFINKTSKRRFKGSGYWRRRGKKLGNGNNSNEINVDMNGCAKRVDLDEDECLPTNGEELGFDTVGLLNEHSKGKQQRSSSPVVKEKSSLDVDRLRKAALNDPTEEKLLSVLKLLFGYDSFRPGQLEAIQRVILDKSTLLLLPTGSGKSLCYQIPAFVLSGITLVISPLIALMEDQMHQLPPLLLGAVFSSNQTLEEASTIIKKLISGEVKVLFVSPERFCADSFLQIVGSLPSISLAVVDEAHCLSEWSHNFRPSYMKLGIVLKQRLKVECVLAMTATATKRTTSVILQSLSIPSSGIVRTSYIRDNLHLSVSQSCNRLKDLLSLLQSPPFSEAKSIIIYCNFQTEAGSISKFLCDNNIPAKGYHGAMQIQERRRIQELFCCDKLRIVVATIAFGLGLDKSNVSAVIHFGLPSCMENYVQEVGRAGRDGRPAYCRLLLDNTNYLKIRSLSHSDSVDTPSLVKFLQTVFSGCSANAKIGHLNSIMIEPMERDLDMKEEVMATVLAYLEVGEVSYIEVLPRVKATCTIEFYKSSPLDLAKGNSLIGSILKSCKPKHGQYCFNLPWLANEAGKSLSEVLKVLKDLQMAKEISYALKDYAFCFRILNVPEDMSSLASSFSARLAQTDLSKVKKLDFMYTAASLAAGSSMNSETNKDVQFPFSLSMQKTIDNYFNLDQEEIGSCETPNAVELSSSFLKADIKVLLQMNSHASFTARSIARVLHGLGSPGYPTSTWSKNHFWGRYMNSDFNVIMQAASEILASRAVPRVT